MRKISAPLKKFKNVNQIVALCAQITAFQTDIKRAIMKEFETSLETGIYKHQTDLLCSSCHVIDLMEFDAKSELVSWYCELQLKDYYSVFRQNPEIAGLDDISRRFAWLKRLLKNFDEQHSKLFPPEWILAERVTVKFCNETRKDLEKILARDENENRFETKCMLAALEVTTDFESKVNMRFNDQVIYL